MTAISLMWWRFEGSDEHEGALSEDQTRGWKLVEAHHYPSPLKRRKGGSMKKSSKSGVLLGGLLLVGQKLKS